MASVKMSQVGMGIFDSFLSNPILESSSRIRFESDSCFIESCRFLVIDPDSESDSDSFLSKIMQYLQNYAMYLLRILRVII